MKIKEITVDAVISNISVVSDFVNEFLENDGCPLKTIMKIDIVIDEIFGNICKYAYENKCGKVEIIVGIDEDSNYVSLTFKDSGIKFDPLEHKRPDVSLSAEEREIGGLGIFIVEKIMDEIDYKYQDGKNVLSILKRW